MASLLKYIASVAFTCTRTATQNTYHDNGEASCARYARHKYLCESNAPSKYDQHWCMSIPTYYMLFPQRKFRDAQAGWNPCVLHRVIIIGELRERRGAKRLVFFLFSFLFFSSLDWPFACSACISHRAVLFKIDIRNLSQALRHPVGSTANNTRSLMLLLDTGNIS